MMQRKITDWAIIGGGMMGMTLALRLAKAGQSVTIYEASPQWGGLTSAWELNREATEKGDVDGSATVRWDRFYHVTLLTDLSLRSLLDEIDLEKEIKWVETKTGFYSRGQLYSMSNSFEFLKFPVLNLYQKARLAGAITWGSKVKNWRRLEQIPVERWLRQVSGNSTYERIWRPLIRAKLGDHFDNISAAFIWAYIARMYKARRTGMKREMFGYVPGGYARVLERLTEELRSRGVTLRSGYPLLHVESEGAATRLEFTDGRSARHAGVIFTIPSPAISSVCPQFNQEEHDKLRGIEYLGVVCASMLSKRSLSPYYVTNITDEWVPLTGIIEMTTIVDPKELGDRHLIYLPKYVLPGDDAAFKESDKSIRERLLSTLERMYPHFSRRDVVDFKVARARNVMALPTLNYSQKLAPMQTSLPGIFTINSSHILKGNLNVNETIQVADQGMEVLRPYLGSSVLPDEGVRRPAGLQPVHPH